MHTPWGPLRVSSWEPWGGRWQGPAGSQQLLLIVLRARGALAHLLIPLAGEGFHLDASVVEVLGQRHNQGLSVGQAQGQRQGEAGWGAALYLAGGWEAGGMATGNFKPVND